MALREKISWGLEKYLWRPLVDKVYGRQRESGWYVIKTYLIWQKIFRINGEVPWPVHPSSKVTSWQKIKMKEPSPLGNGRGCYIQAGNGIEIGKNFRMGPNVGIIGANHCKADLNRWVKAPPIRIGDNVWVGMNSVIL